MGFVYFSRVSGDRTSAILTLSVLELRSSGIRFHLSNAHTHTHTCSAPALWRHPVAGRKHSTTEQISFIKLYSNTMGAWRSFSLNELNKCDFIRMCFTQLNLQCCEKIICSLLLLIQDILKFEFTHKSGT